MSVVYGVYPAPNGMSSTDLYTQINVVAVCDVLSLTPDRPEPDRMICCVVCGTNCGILYSMVRCARQIIRGCGWERWRGSWGDVVDILRGILVRYSRVYKYCKY
jgi:hypothetical protein